MLLFCIFLGINDPTTTIDETKTTINDYGPEQKNIDIRKRNSTILINYEMAVHETLLDWFLEGRNKCYKCLVVHDGTYNGIFWFFLLSAMQKNGVLFMLETFLLPLLILQIVYIRQNN